MFKKIALILGVGIVGASFAVNVSVSTDADALVNALLGEGITLVAGSATLTGGALASGTYTDAGSVITQGQGLLSEGIVLSSGSANYLENNTNTSDGITGNFGLGGDADLNALIPGYTTYDATVLEFDFEVTGDGDVTSSFWYVFGSDEYDEYVNSSFNDVFGFFVDGVNVATIPGTDVAVSINNVNAGSNAAYFNQNDINVGAPYATEMDGFTTALSTEFTLDAGSTHHMKLAIADAGDHILDSWVMLGGKSFVNTPPIPPQGVPEPGSMSLLVTGLLCVAGYGFSRKK